MVEAAAIARAGKNGGGSLAERTIVHQNRQSPVAFRISPTVTAHSTEKERPFSEIFRRSQITSEFKRDSLWNSFGDFGGLEKHMNFKFCTPTL